MFSGEIRNDKPLRTELCYHQTVSLTVADIGIHAVLQMNMDLMAVLFLTLFTTHLPLLVTPEDMARPRRERVPRKR